MKTYKDFKAFIEQPKYLGTVWEYVRSEAIKNGFKKWQVWLYTRHYRHTRISLKPICKKILKLCWYVLVVVGLIAFTWDMRKLIQSTTRKNDMQSIESLIHICKESPDVCNKVGKIWHKGI